MRSESSSSDMAIQAQAVSKCHELFDRPGDRIKSLLWGQWRRYSRDFWSLRDVSFVVNPGEVVGVVGRNGAGKSTLLQLVCGTLVPSSGSMVVRGRVAALLELGAGFSPDFSGLENVFINAAILGLSRSETEAQLDSILEFADIGDFIHQPVKTYSSGMFMRLAFAVATSVEPDILVIDEALAVGDGAFARKSFDRIMQLKDAGKTILFCSHSMYQVEALCSRALWVEEGRLKMDGSAAEVTSAYQSSLNASALSIRSSLGEVWRSGIHEGNGRLVSVRAEVDGIPVASDGVAQVMSCQSTLTLKMVFEIDPALPVPALALGFSDANGLTVASATSHNDGVILHRDAQGRGEAQVVFERLPLLKGHYYVTGFLISENAVHVYDQVERVVRIDVLQEGLEQGVVRLPHVWLL